MTQLQAGPLNFEWQENWGQRPSKPEYFSHHGMACTADGEIVVGDVNDPVLSFYSPAGKLLRVAEIAAPVVETHALCCMRSENENYILVADIGHKDGDETKHGIGQVLVCTGTGAVVQRFGPEHCGYSADDTQFKPTGVAVDTETGHIWIADGYGYGVVHCLSASGQHVCSINGSEGAGLFACPHSVWIDTRRVEQTLIYVADRGNGRVQIFDSTGCFHSVITHKEFRSPSAFAQVETYVIIVDLCAQLVVLDAENAVVATLADGKECVSRPGWPNALNEKNELQPPDLPVGILNSPHGITADADGNLYISEWLLGGRYIKLNRRK